MLEFWAKTESIWNVAFRVPLSVSALREARLPLLVVALHAIILLGCILMSFFLPCYHAHPIRCSSNLVDSTPQVLSNPLSLTRSPSTAVWRTGHLAPGLQQSSLWIRKVPLTPPVYSPSQMVAKCPPSTLSLLTLVQDLMLPQAVTGTLYLRTGL